MADPHCDGQGNGPGVPWPCGVAVVLVVVALAINTVGTTIIICKIRFDRTFPA